MRIIAPVVAKMKIINRPKIRSCVRLHRQNDLQRVCRKNRRQSNCCGRHKFTTAVWTGEDICLIRTILSNFKIIVPFGRNL